MSERRFKVLSSYFFPTKIKSIPWDFIEPHRLQANTNHYQSLERLNERGGLSPWEIRCVVHDVTTYKSPRDWTESNCVQWLEELFPDD